MSNALAAEEDGEYIEAAPLRETTSESSTTLLRRAIFLVVLGAAVLVGQVQDLSGDVSAVATPFILGIGLALLPLVWHRRLDAFEPASFNGIYLALGLASSFASVLQAGKVELLFIPQLSPRAKGELAGTVVWSYVLAQACYLIGYYLPRRGQVQKPSRLAGLEWSSQRMMIACFACLALALPVYAFFQSELQADLTDITHLARGKAVWREDATRTWILRGMMLGCLPAMIWLALVLEKRSKMGLLAVSAFIFVEGFLILRAAQRSLTFNFFIACGALYHYMWRKIPVALLVGVGFVALVSSNVLRDYRTQDIDEVRPTVTAPISERFNASRALSEHEDDRQRLSTLAMVFYYFPEKHDFLLGETWYGLVSIPIPRWLWPEKGDAFVWRDSHMAIELVGAHVPVPFHGVLYANFSWFGVVLGMLAWGLFQRRFYDWAMASRRDKNTALIYVNALFVTSPMLLPLTYFTQFVVPLLLIILFMGDRLRSRRAPELRSPEPASGAM